MNHGFGLILAIPIFFMAMVSLMVIDSVKKEQMQLEEYVMTFAIDYSTDAAVEEMLNMSHLGQDYTNQSMTNADPEIALDTFLNMMCINHDIPMTDRAKLQIESTYIPVFCVAAYDGYYLYTPTKGQDEGWYMQSTPKIPYAYEKDGRYLALNLGGDNAYVYADGKITKESLKDLGITHQEVLYQINTVVSDALMYTFQENTGRGSRFVYIPTALTTFTKVNPITGPSVISFIDGWDLKTNSPISAFSVGGAQIEVSRMVAGYEVVNPDGTTTKLYAYADLLPAGVVVIDLFTSVENAARAGYHYDPVYMG